MIKPRRNPNYGMADRRLYTQHEIKRLARVRRAADIGAAVLTGIAALAIGVIIIALAFPSG
jgi:DNA-binding transcriptional MerR regulator